MRFERTGWWAGLSVMVLAYGCAKAYVDRPSRDDDDDEDAGADAATDGGGTPDGGEGGPEDGGDLEGGDAEGGPPLCLDSECSHLDGICTVGECGDGGECVAAPTNEYGPCDDGKFCTVNDSCVAGKCTSKTTKWCPPPDSCHISTCDEATKSCKTQPGNNGGPCDDGNPCSQQTTCLNGKCQGGYPMDCSFLDDTCNVGVCDPVAGCKKVPVNDGAPCEDGLYCTQQTTCLAGACQGGGPLNCAGTNDTCMISICDEASASCTPVPGNEGAQCDDGSPCTGSTTCSGGVCKNGVPTNDGAPCDDGATCTVGEFCTAGVCGGGAGPTVYFTEDFSDNSAGWILGKEWEIGPAEASQGGNGNPDPDTDHTPTADDGIAGVVIGGNAQTILHDWYFLESPPFDTSQASGSVVFGYYRWLNSDYDPYMHNRIDVWNGAQWVNLWITGPSPGVMDSEWTYQSFDVTAHKNAQMRLRWGFDITSSGVYTIGSWNVDDVLVASQACP